MFHAASSRTHPAQPDQQQRGQRDNDEQEVDAADPKPMLPYSTISRRTKPDMLMVLLPLEVST